MSHIGVLILANWLADETNGVNALAALMPRVDGHPAPPAVTIYNEIDQGWVARGRVPKPATGIAFPAVIVFLQNGKFDGGVPLSESTGARSIDATVQFAVQLLMDESQTEAATTAGLYLVRAIRNSLLLLDDPANDAARTALGVRLEPSDSVMQGQLDAPEGDSIVSVAALVVIYTTCEVTVLV